MILQRTLELPSRQFLVIPPGSRDFVSSYRRYALYCLPGTKNEGEKLNLLNERAVCIVKILGRLAIAEAGIWLLGKDKSDKELGTNEFDGIVKDALYKAEKLGLSDLDLDVIENIIVSDTSKI